MSWNRVPTAPLGLHCRREAEQRRRPVTVRLSALQCCERQTPTSSQWCRSLSLSPSSLLQYRPGSTHQRIPRTLSLELLDSNSHSSVHRLWRSTSRQSWSIWGTSCQWLTLTCQDGWEMSVAPFTGRSTFCPVRWREEAEERTGPGTSREPTPCARWLPAAGSPSAGSRCAASNACLYDDAQRPTPPLL